MSVIGKYNLVASMYDDRSRPLSALPRKDSAAPVKPQSKAPAKTKTPSPKEDSEEPQDPPSRELASKKDYQLGQALNLLKGLQFMQNKP